MTGDILIVDDLPENLRVLGAILEGEGYKVRLAMSGAAALKAAALRRPDLILMDIRMPVMDGLETCRRLLAGPGGTGLPVLFLSASDDQADRLEAFASGAVDFIAKPFHAQEVLARVTTHLTIARLRSALATANARLAGEVVAETTARRQAESAVRATAEQLDLALGAAGMGVWEADLGPGLVRLDARARGILGTARGTLAMADLADGFAGPDRPALAAALAAGQDHGTPFRLEGWWPVPAGQRRIRLHGEPSSADRRHLVGLVWDITAEHDLRHRLALSEKLECLGRLAGGVAHDFNNNLGVIIGGLDLLRRRMPADERTAPLFDAMLRASENSASLIRDLMTFARGREAELKAIDLNQAVERSRGLIGTAVGRQIALQFTTDPRPLPVLGHLELLQNAVLNLCVNARDAMPAGGRIAISAGRRLLAGKCRICGIDLAGTQAVLEVADDGSGIPEEIQARIFEPFFTTKAEGKGTGLGLATVVGCVRQHGGHLSLESSPGIGSVFRIHLPLLEDDPGGG